MTQSTMTESIIAFNEPELEFGYQQRMTDPRDGLTIFGPFDIDVPSRPVTLPYIIIGTNEGIAQFEAWSDVMNRPAFDPKANLRLWPPFPGFEAVFCSHWSSKPIWSYPIDRTPLIEASHRREKHERAFAVVEPYLEQIEKASKLDENIGVAICVVPDEIGRIVVQSLKLLIPLVNVFLLKQYGVERQVNLKFSMILIESNISCHLIFGDSLKRVQCNMEFLCRFYVNLHYG